MAQQKASAATRSGQRKPARKGASPWLFLALMVPVGLFVLPTSVILMVGLIPTVVALLIDRDPDKTAAITVGAMNLCGVLPFLLDLWKHHHTMPAALHTISDPLSWLVMYGAAGVGWVLYFTIPPVVVNFEVLRSESRIEDLLRQKRELIEEWGPEVAMDDEALAARSANRGL
jgi:hypothetical protein